MDSVYILNRRITVIEGMNQEFIIRNKTSVWVKLKNSTVMTGVLLISLSVFYQLRLAPCHKEGKENLVSQESWRYRKYHFAHLQNALYRTPHGPEAFCHLNRRMHLLQLAN